MSEEKTRFEMVKRRHKETFEKALVEGKVDRQMVGIGKHFAKTKDYFTSSGCAGRILLLGLGKSRGKKDSYFLRKWHRKVRFKEVWSALQEKSKGEVWFKLESFIIHIGASDLEHAKRVMRVVHKNGVKRFGIMVAKPGKFIVELIGTQGMSMLVKRRDKVLVDRGFLKEQVKVANKKIELNYAHSKKLERAFKKELA